MSKAVKCAAVALSFLAALCLSPPLSSGDGPVSPVDFRMAPLEQAKKIHAVAHTEGNPGATLTIMVVGKDGTKDGNHIILAGAPRGPGSIRDQLATEVIDGVSWTDDENQTRGACDSLGECQSKTDEMCDMAGHSGVQMVTVKITTHSDGSKTCSGDCLGNGAVAFVTCTPSNCLACS